MGLVTKKQVYVNGRITDMEEAQHRRALRILLRDPRVETLIQSVSTKRIVSRGLGVERCDVAAITTHHAQDEDSMFANALGVLANTTSGVIAVSARNESARQVVSGFDPARLILICDGLNDWYVKQHLDVGGLVVFKVNHPDHDRIVIHRGKELVASFRAPPTPVNYHDEPSLFAVALAFGLGLSQERIEAGVRPERVGELVVG